MTAIPENPDALLTRNQTATALTEAGFPVSSATLSTKATRGGGPAFAKFGPRTLYRWATALAWAQRRLTDPVRSTSESDGASGSTAHQAGKSGVADVAAQRSHRQSPGPKASTARKHREDQEGVRATRSFDRRAPA
jgi:hypothetical protein